MRPLPLTLGLMGLAGSGKDTAADRLVQQHGFVQLAFADALREATLALDPYVLTVHGTTLRLSVLIDDLGWEDAKRTEPEVRRLLQAMGTDAVRQHVDVAAWTRIVERKIRHLRLQRPETHVVISDVRFADEAALVHDQTFGRLVALRRPGLEPLAGSMSTRHVSEELDAVSIADHTLVNDSDIEHLCRRVDSLVHSLVPS